MEEIANTASATCDSACLLGWLTLGLVGLGCIAAVVVPTILYWLKSRREQEQKDRGHLSQLRKAIRQYLENLDKQKGFSILGPSRGPGEESRELRKEMMTHACALPEKYGKFRKTLEGPCDNNDLRDMLQEIDEILGMDKGGETEGEGEG